MKIYNSFSNIVINTFLTNDKRGEYASLIIDEQFMNNAAYELRISLKDLINNLKLELFSLSSNDIFDISKIISIVSLQLYAAYKCEKDDNGNYTSRAYNPKLAELINYDINDLQQWYANNQLNVWNQFYNWCRENHFLVSECAPKDHNYKYAQYPIELSKNILNREDLKYVASVFNKLKLEPYEDINYSDFWGILDIKIDFTGLNKHTQRVFETVNQERHEYDIVQSQIYNHYLNWDGEYIDPFNNHPKQINYLKKYNVYLSDKNDQYKIDIRGNNGNRVIYMDIKLRSIEELKKYYNYKNKGIIIFKKSDDGDPNYWEETRLIDDKEDNGIALVSDSLERYKFQQSRIVYRCTGIVVYKFSYNNLTKDFYCNDERVYKLTDGLKLARGKYLLGGDPILHIYKDCSYLFDGKPQNILKGDNILNLSIGKHILKFPKSKELKLIIIYPKKRKCKWNDRYFKWKIDKKNMKWEPEETNSGVYGLNFMFYSKSNNTHSTLKRWIKLNQIDENIK